MHHEVTEVFHGNAKLTVMVNNVVVAEQIRSSSSTVGMAIQMVGAGKPTSFGIDPRSCPSTINLRSRKNHDDSCDYKHVQEQPQLSAPSPDEPGSPPQGV